MKVALISQNASPGLMIFRKDFIEYLVLAGHDVFLFAIDYSELTRSLVEDMGAIAVDYSLSKTGITPFKDIKDTWLLSRKLKELKVDVTFSFFIKPSIYGTIAAKIASVPRRIAMLEGLGYIHS
ncbi:MAG: glycosyltransferase [Candidatus Endonucleobacter sp. (ex Gigantidas childressi)]|nr:glycosyltransferase [Candidatus Endonucleobacter sp. (ex Gigantidas childressi)]